MDRDWLKLIMDYARDRGHLSVSYDNHVHLSASMKDGCHASVPQHLFDVFIEAGFIDQTGAVL